MATWDDLLTCTRPWVVAHRGYSARFPENTLASFEGAIEAGADVLEMDVTFTADRVPIVHHDDKVDRTTNGAGLVAYMSAAMVSQLDAGSWFDSSFAGERIPTLESVFQHIGSRVVLDLELRAAAFEEEDSSDTLELAVLRLIRRHGLERSVILSSFEPRYFARIERHANDIPRILLCDQGMCEMDAMAACQRIGALALGPDAELVQRMDLLRLRTGGLKVLPWTVNDEADMRRFLEWGVDGILTDEVARLRALIPAEGNGVSLPSTA